MQNDWFGGTEGRLLGVTVLLNFAVELKYDKCHGHRETDPFVIHETIDWLGSLLHVQACFTLLSF